MSATDQAGLEFDTDEATAGWLPETDEDEEAGCDCETMLDPEADEATGLTAAAADAETGADCDCEPDEEETTEADGCDCCGLTMLGITCEAWAIICGLCCCCCWLAARELAYCCCCCW